MVSRAERSLVGDWWWTIDKALVAALGVLMTSGVVLLMAGGPPVAQRLLSTVVAKPALKLEPMRAYARMEQLLPSAIMSKMDCEPPTRACVRTLMLLPACM